MNLKKKKWKMKKKYKDIQASEASDSIHIVEANAEPVQFIEAAAEGGEEGEPKLKKFSMTAYTGGKMNVGFGMPVVVDLSGMKVSSKSRPILKDHNPGMVVGHTEKISISGGTIRATGVVSGANGYADEITMSSAKGFPWQASIGASIDRMVEVAKGESVQVNGKTFSGPVYVARKSTLKEISFVALGADDNTNARVAAKNNSSKSETITMGFEAWLKAQGLDVDSLGEEAVKNLKATYEKLQDVEAKADDVQADDVQADAGDEIDVKAAVAELRAEHHRLAEINKIAGDHPDIVAKAIDNGWSKDRTELEVLRAARPEAPNVNTGAGRVEGVTEDVLSAAVCMAGNLSDVEAQFDEKTLEAAHKRYKGRIGLQEVMCEAAVANGYAGSPSFRRDDKGIIRAAFSTAGSQNIHAASGFSTLSITDILSNVANKFLLAGYNAIESGWRDISVIKNVSDFKQNTSYRLTGDLEYEEVGAGGEIKHGSVADESYTNQAKTYAKMLSITRQDQINDDLGALTDVPNRLGRGAALKVNKVFWTAFLDNTSFFTAGRNNLETSNALSIGGLTTAETAFFDQTDPDGQPLGLMPEILLVPNALNVTASNIMNSTMVEASTTADTPIPGNNPHAGKFRVVRSSYLSNSALGGAQSTSTWYLLANPATLSTMCVSFLNGVQTPVIETADADFNTLGIQMRGYHDFGVDQHEYRAGVKCTA